MRDRRLLGFDELMIVNPGPLGRAAGTLYRIRGLRKKHTLPRLRHCFLGDDGCLYQVQGSGEENVTECGHYVLGADGGLYEIVH